MRSAILISCILAVSWSTTCSAETMTVSVPATSGSHTIHLGESHYQVSAVSYSVAGTAEGSRWACWRFDRQEGEWVFSYYFEVPKYIGIYQTIGGCQLWDEWRQAANGGFTITGRPVEIMGNDCEPLLVDRDLPLSISFGNDPAVLSDTCCDYYTYRLAQELVSPGQLTFATAFTFVIEYEAVVPAGRSGWGTVKARYR